MSRMIEFVDHLHEHFVTPVDVHDGRYRTPSAPGAGTEMLARSLADHEFPDGPACAAETVPADAVRVT